MTPRYYARYAGKEGFEERYHVIDSSVNEPVSPRMLYHEANDQAEARNKGEWTEVFSLGGWLAPAGLDHG